MKYLGCKSLLINPILILSLLMVSCSGEKTDEYGIADFAMSTHASFFDYDKDGDLDCYLLSNSFQSVSEFDIKPGQRKIRDTLGGNKLYRNDDGYFKDVSKKAGIYGSKIGFGLSISAGDINRDGWIDMYVSNDFFERDYIYINNKDGTFTESLEKQFEEISLGAMGADMADINNDGYPEIYTTEMTAEENSRLKTKVLFESWDKYHQKLKMGYYRQFARNVLQLNNRNNSFSEIGRLSNVNRTDWSWGALIMDLDNDGDLDLVINNVNMPSFVYRNETQDRPGKNFLMISLKGYGQNTSAIGSEVTLYYNGQKNYQQLIPMRGFKSCVDKRLHFGLGEIEQIDTIEVIWLDGKCSVLKNVKANQFLTLYQKDAKEKCLNVPVKRSPPVFKNADSTIDLEFTHKENDFVDFERNRLLFLMISNEGPHMAVADVNGDWKDDLYIGGAKNSPGALFIQEEKGHFKRTNLKLFEADKISEDTDCSFFDADGDGDPDLYVTSGGPEFPVTKYVSSSCVQPADYDNDGDGSVEQIICTYIYSASYGLYLKGNRDGTWKPVPSDLSGFFSRGEIRDMKILNIFDAPVIAVAKNNDKLQFFKY